jgi:hypothetical protein
LWHLSARKFIGDLAECSSELTQIRPTRDTSIPTKGLETCLGISAKLREIHQLVARKFVITHC